MVLTVKHRFWVCLPGSLEGQLVFRSETEHRRPSISNMSRHRPSHPGPTQNRTAEERKHSPLPLLGWVTHFSCPLISELLVLGPSDSTELHHQVSLACSFHTAALGFPASKIKEQIPLRSFLLSLQLYPTGSVCLEDQVELLSLLQWKNSS
jgi:hypothetical protein